MFALLLAVLLLAINLALNYPHPSLEPLEPILVWYQDNQSFVLLSLVVFYLGLYLFSRNRIIELSLELKEKQSFNKAEGQDLATAALLDEGTRLKKQIRDLQHQLEDRSNERKSADEKNQELQTALAEQKMRIDALSQSAIKRDRTGDLEVLHFLSMFQTKGRLLDFLMDDITPFDDSQIGRAARVVHQGCKAVLDECFKIGPVHPGKEGDDLSLEEGYPSNKYRLVGKVVGNPPYKGRILHQGWQTSIVNLPTISERETSSPDGLIISPAEVEV